MEAFSSLNELDSQEPPCLYRLADFSLTWLNTSLKQTEEQSLAISFHCYSSIGSLTYNVRCTFSFCVESCSCEWTMRRAVASELEPMVWRQGTYLWICSIHGGREGQLSVHIRNFAAKQEQGNLGQIYALQERLGSTLGRQHYKFFGAGTASSWLCIFTVDCSM